MKKLKNLWIATLLLSGSQILAQCPTYLALVKTDAGSGAYILEAIVDNPSNYVLTSEWFYYPQFGTGGGSGYAHFNDPGTYAVGMILTYDDPQTSEVENCVLNASDEVEITCYAVGDAYPENIIDYDNQTLIVIPPTSLGTPPFTYSWDTDVNYVVNADNSITIPFNNEGYISGNLTMTDANGCFSWPHMFGSANPWATCSLNFNTSINGQTATVDVTIMNGTDVSIYPYYMVNFGDGTEEVVYMQSTVEHTYAQEGSYVICVTSYGEFEDSCEAFLCQDVLTGTAAGIAENESTDFNIYPNPAAGDVTISGKAGDVVSVTDSYGKLIHQESLKENMPINVAALTPGIYLVKKSSPTGKTEVKKLIVQ